MRRLKTFFLTLLLALVASSAFATTFEDGKVIKIGDPVTEVQTGQWYALYSMLGGWVYDKNAGEKGNKAYWLTDESNLQTGMVANDVKDYLLQFVDSKTEGAYYIQYANDNYMYMWSSYQYAWSWSKSSTETIVKVQGTEDVFSIHETGANYCLYTYPGTSACVSWQTGTVTQSWDDNYKYKFYPVEIVDPEPVIGDELQPGDEVDVDGVTYEILSENMVENFDFSDGFTGWTGARDFTTEITNDRFELVEGGALHGDNYLVGTFLGDAANNGALGKVWEIAPYRTYYFSYWVKAYENACDTTDGKWLKTSLTDIPGIEKVILEEEKKDISSEWKKVEVVFTNTDGYAYLQIDFRWLNSQYGLDDFQLYELVQNSETVLEDETEFGNWKIEGNTGGSFQYNTWSTEADPSGMKTPFIEYWVGSGNQLSDATISHETLTDLAPGFYTVSLDARAFNENTLTKVAPGIVLSANGTSVDLSLGTHDVYDGVSAEVYGTYEVPCMVHSDGTLDIAITLTGSNCDWLAFKNLKVTFLGTEYELPAVEDIAAVEGDMSAKASEAQEAAIAAYIEEQNTETVIALYQAQAEAKLSANFYAEIAETIADLDEAGQAYFATTEEGAAYEAKTLEYTDMTEVYVASMKQQTTIGKDLSLVVESTEWIGQNGTYQTGVERYQTDNYTAEEGNILYQHIEGLVPGSWYEVTFYAVASSTSGRGFDNIAGDGIAKVFANDVSEGVTVYDQTGCTITDYPHTLTCEVGEDGVLEYGLQNIATGGNWYVAQAISLTIADEVLTDTESDYHIGDIVEIDGIEYEVQSENMVENHSFELGFTGWTSANDFTTEITSAKFDWVNDGTAQDGKRHLVGTTNSSSSSDGSLGTAWAIEPGKTYMMSYWIKNLDGTEETEYLKTSLTNTPGDETEVLGYPETVDSDWQKVEYVFDNDSYAYVQVKFRWLENHWAFDNFQIYEILAPEEVIEPGDVVHECVAEESHWTTDGTTGIAYNTWSVEEDASGMVAPFLQLWVWGLDATQSSLEAATVSHETLTDLEPGSYEVSLDIRIYSEVGNEIGEGTTFNANGVSADLLLEGNEATNSTDDYEHETLVYGTYVLTCTVGEEGTLDISINVPEGVEYNWIAWKNLTVTYLGEVEEPEPALAEGEYLIVDADGNYLGGGLTYGTQAAIIGKPQFIGFELQEDGTYHLDSHQYNSADSHYLGSNLYFDSTPVDWTVEEVDGGITIYGTVDAGTGYLTSNGFQTVPTVEADPYVWTLLTIEDVIAGMDEATLDAPVDVTALIASPELKRNSNTAYHPTWTVTGYDGTGTPSNYAFGGGSAVANCAESYHSTNGFNFSQEITLPLAGYYTLSAKGFYRDDNSTTLLLPVMYAGEETSTFPELDTSANNMAEAYADFLEGLHQIEAIGIVAVEDGDTVVIGFKGEDTSLWNIMGELELLYLGAEAPVDNSYHFVNTEWVASDNGRVTADNITYNDDNTITVVASGTNNVALGNNPSQSWNDSKRDDVTTAEYTITEDQCYFVVVGSDLSTAEGDSYWWWMNGINDWTRNSAQIAPDEIYELSGQIMFVWDLTSYISDTNNNMTADEDGLITLNGCTCFGLTSTTGTSTISDINFYTWDNLTDKYPELASSTPLAGVSGDVQTGISNVAEDVEIDGIYDLTGRKVSKTVKGGIYIIDGKKVLVK